MVGRIEEKKYLQELIYEEEPQFVAVFGRRRVGKTYLIRESFNHNFFFEHTGASNNDVEESMSSMKQRQLDKFRESLIEAGMDEAPMLKNWDEAFACLKQLIKESDEKKKVIFIDELSWMDTKNSGLISALENFWNGFATARKEKDIVLIICASATYWMIDNIVNSRGGLHNRLTGKIYLKPFTLGECEEYLHAKNIIFNRHQILQCYMIMGGVPYYWSLLKKGKSLPQNIDDIFFRDGAVLENEYDNMYSALFNKPDLHLKIIDALSSTNKGLTREEICDRINIEGSGNLSKKLSELENCGFIRKYIPYGYKSRNCIYQIIDNFTLFYYKFIKNKTGDEKYWENHIGSSNVLAWSGIAFERVCLQHVTQIKKALGIAGVSTEVNAWQSKKNDEKGIYGSQIDLLIVRKDQIINVCEMKYSESDYKVDADYDRDMRRKMEDFRRLTGTKYALHSTLVTTYGVTNSSYAGNIQAVITAEDLFA